MIPLVDDDDGLRIGIDESVIGNIDYRSDSDWYLIQLQEGDEVRISTDSMAVDTIVFVYPSETIDSDASDGQIAFDDDSGGGLFGVNAELVYQAPHTGAFYVAVADALGADVGGYYLSVERVSDGT